MQEMPSLALGGGSNVLLAHDYAGVVVRNEINGIEITDNQLISSLDKIAESKNSTELTFFEYLTVAAVYFFSRQKLDFIVLLCSSVRNRLNISILIGKS